MGHLLKSVLGRGFILIRQVFSPVHENLSHSLSRRSPSWLSGLNLAFEKYMISVLFSTAILKTGRKTFEPHESCILGDVHKQE